MTTFKAHSAEPFHLTPVWLQRWPLARPTIKCLDLLESQFSVQDGAPHLVSIWSERSLCLRCLNTPLPAYWI